MGIKLKDEDVVTFGNFRVECFLDELTGEKTLKIIVDKGNISVHPRQHNSVTIKNPKQ